MMFGEKLSIHTQSNPEKAYADNLQIKIMCCKKLEKVLICVHDKGCDEEEYMSEPFRERDIWCESLMEKTWKVASEPVR